MDPTGHDAFARALAYGHPTLMIVALGLAALALRAGLQLKRRRSEAGPPKRGLLAQHMRVAKPAVLLMLLGLLGGPASSWLLRGWIPLGTLHAWLGLAAAALFGTAGYLGLQLERGRRVGDRAAMVNRHGLIGTLAMLAAGIAAAAGMVLLP